MESAFTFITLFSLILLANTVDAKPDPTLEAVRKDGSMPRAAVEDRRPRPETIEGLLPKGTSVLRAPNENTDCHTSAEAKRDEKPFMKDFEPRPNVSAHDDDGKLTELKLSTDDFEPRPSVTGYNNEVHPEEDKEAFVHDFEPRPSVTGYNNEVPPEEKDNEVHPELRG